MRTKSMRFITVALGSLLLVGGTSGCQISFPFEISGVVLKAHTGTALAGVSVTIEGDGIREADEAPFPVVTGPDGTFHAKFKARDSAFGARQLPKWSLILSKKGYKDSTVDVSPKQVPESGSETTKLTVEVQMKAIK